MVIDQLSKCLLVGLILYNIKINYDAFVWRRSEKKKRFWINLNQLCTQQNVHQLNSRSELYIVLEA